MDSFDPKQVEAMANELERRTARLQMKTAQLEEQTRTDTQITAQYDALTRQVLELGKRIEAGDLSAVDDLIALKRRAETLD